MKLLTNGTISQTINSPGLKGDTFVFGGYALYANYTGNVTIRLTLVKENGIETKEDMVNKIDGFMKTFDPFNYADNEQFIGFNHDSILRDINNNDIDSIKDFLNQIIDEDMESEMTKEAEKYVCNNA